VDSVRHRLLQWYRTTARGRRQRIQIMSEMGRILEDWFGYHLLVIGVDPDLDIAAMTRVRQITRAIPGPLSGDAPGNRLVTLDEELPVATESIDVVVLVHALDYSPAPHQLLREIHRVLTPHGHLLVVGSNPFSFLGLWRSLLNSLGGRQTSPLAPGPNRLTDWLRLLDFSVAPPRHKLVLPLAGTGRVGDWLERLDNWLVEHNVGLGSAFVLAANKTVRGHISGLPVTPIRRRLMGLPSAGPVVGARESIPRTHSHCLRTVD